MIFTLEISLGFDDFGWSSLQDQAHADGLELDQLIDLACNYYESQLGSAERRCACRVSNNPPADGRTASCSSRWGRRLVVELEQEALRQGVGFERLLEHAAMFYLADLDAGRVTERIRPAHRPLAAVTEIPPGRSSGRLK